MSNDIVRISWADIDGIPRGKLVSQKKFQKIASEGFGFCNVVYGWSMQDQVYSKDGLSGWNTGFPDDEFEIALESKSCCPTDLAVPWFLSSLKPRNGETFHPACSRSLLKNILSKAEKMYIGVRMAQEFEWFNFYKPENYTSLKQVSQAPISKGMFGYSLLRMSQSKDFINALFTKSQALGIEIEGFHTETGPGVFEACLSHKNILYAADQAHMFKSLVKEVASEFQIMPSFMAKWNTNLPGSGGHIHQSIYDLKTKKNISYDENSDFKLSTEFEHYLAGVYHCMPDLMPMYAPNINSYKRYVSGAWAATHQSWGIENRTCAIRIINRTADQCRVETRVPGADVNPYLAFAATLASGLYGIENKLTLPKPIIGDACNTKGLNKLANTLPEANQIFKNSSLAKELFGEDFVKHYSLTREEEIAQFGQLDEDGEIERYFEIV